ncbi:MAG TPA: hypothetical protein VLE72_00060 [Candidatus Saccharimonadales bacterium]|nr:hypothetical protein [Candidatus Saccharimonadales bacterium]
MPAQDSPFAKGERKKVLANLDAGKPITPRQQRLITIERNARDPNLQRQAELARREREIAQPPGPRRQRYGGGVRHVEGGQDPTGKDAPANMNDSILRQ